MCAWLVCGYELEYAVGVWWCVRVFVCGWLLCDAIDDGFHTCDVWLWVACCVDGWLYVCRCMLVCGHVLLLVLVLCMVVGCGVGVLSGAGVGVLRAVRLWCAVLCGRWVVSCCVVA